MSEMPESNTSESMEPPKESKALRLARYLKEFVGLRSTTIRDVEKYETVLWFGDIPQEPECQSPAWSDSFEQGDPWLEVRKQQFPKPPEPPEVILKWIDPQAMKRATPEAPQLRESVALPDLEVEIGEGEEPAFRLHHLAEHPEISRAYERFRPSWEVWSSEYRRRAKIQTVYAELFRLHTQLRKQGEIFELILGLGLLDWRNPGVGKAHPIRRHVVVGRVDLTFDPGTGTIRVEGAADGTQLRIEDDMLEAELRPERGHYAAVTEQLNAIDDDIWDHSSMHSALKAWAGALSANSQWSSELKPGKDDDGRPLISFAPALILRKRTQTGMVRIYEKMVEQLASDQVEIPAGWSSLIADEDDDDDSGYWSESDALTTQLNGNASEIYFPLAANREQRRIVEAIDQKRGVLVQGPPGTGKSHTIANLMCHMLATGKRVLITAETGHALQVLKDKLPVELQPLCVSLLGQGGDAFAELNSAIQGITTRYATYRPGDYDERIAEIDRELDANRRVLAKIDSELRSLREEETQKHILANGEFQGTASTIAEGVAREREQFNWLRLPQESAEIPPVSDADLSSWLRICRSYDDETIKNSTLRIVASDKLPTPQGFANAVAAERDAKVNGERFSDIRQHLAYGPIVALQKGAREKLKDHLQQREIERRKIDRASGEWVNQVLSAALSGRHAIWRALSERTHELIIGIDRLIKVVGSNSVLIKTAKDARSVRTDALAVIQHLEAGGKWKNWGFLIPKALKDRTYLCDSVTVDGQPADTVERLQLVVEYLNLTFAVEDIERIWHDHGGLPQGSELRLRLVAINEHVSILDETLLHGQNCLKLGEAMKAAVPMIPEPEWINGQAQAWLKIVDAAETAELQRSATEQVTTCLRDLKVTQALFDAHSIVGSLVAEIERRDVTAFSQLYMQLQKIEQTRMDQLRRSQIEEKLNATVPGLVGTVRVTLNDSSWDERFRLWPRAWNWAVADIWLTKRADRAYQRDLWQRRFDTDKSIARLLAESAGLRAWTHFFKRLTTKESAALKGWLGAVQAMGKGTGRSGKIERLRRQARQYMDQCREAIPVWIMPRYLVAEMIDPAPGRYDVIIADEASQLGIESLFLFYISKKLVVVGDDQQISPYGIGIADGSIEGLQQHYLDGIPHHFALSAQSSLYGNAKIRFGQNIVLREHFRCMPEIIQFSNDLCYASNGTPLDPLRSYPANRLKPLVLRHVPEGYRTGGSQHALNEPEADAILAQIVACINDPRYENCSMGVISLQGEAQGKLIEKKLLEVLEPEVIEERRLICGDAYAFQGDERNIIFLSMVAAPNERIGALASDSARQRFNVAASRAQDQLWLFHSATLDVLSPSCMRHRLLNYMINPGRQETAANEQQFDSQFERHIYELISNRGFHVRTQVVVGDPTNHRYRIDLVVEGMQGRLAVECDGDEWHGPDRYESDIARQRDLERAGWQFVRIRGSEFYRDRAKAMEPLWVELQRLGIMPGGIDETLAEPPPSVDSDQLERKEIEEVIPLEHVPVNTREADDPDAEDTKSVNLKSASLAQNGELPLEDPSETSNSPLERYIAYSGPAGLDPRIANPSVIAEGLCRIVEVEGPMVAKRAYDIYLRGCGIRRLGHELRSTMNKALADAIRRERVVSEEESGVRGLLYSVIRPKGSVPVKVRRRGARSFEEIPPSELQAVARYLQERDRLESGSDEHLRAILDCYDLKRLTTQVGTTVLEILEKDFPYIADAIATLKFIHDTL